MNTDMKWEYKVLPVDKLFLDDRNHEIAVSKVEAASRRERKGSEIENMLNKLGSDGWEFVSFLGELSIFKKQAS